MKLMLFLCLAVVVAGGKNKEKWENLFKKISSLRKKVDAVSEIVQDQIEICQDNGQLNNLTSSCGLLPSLLGNVEQIRENTALCTKKNRPGSCVELLEKGHNMSGLYRIYPKTWTKPIEVYCDQETDGGGWIVFQRREDGTEEFYRDWKDYKLGFGNLIGEFWLGLEYIHILTAGSGYELRIDLQDFDNNKTHAKYQNFSVGPKTGNYVLTATGYSGDAGDAMTERHNGSPFSTKDRDNDAYSTSCAQRFKGGWWYESCHRANLNGLYHYGTHTSYADGVNWFQWKGYYYSLKFTEMKFR